MKQLAKANVTYRNASEIDKQFGVLDRWTFLMMQIFETKSFLELAENTRSVHPQSSMEEVLTQQALFRAFLLSYGKCFTSSGEGRSSLDPKKVFDGKESVIPVHERIMELRHKFAAHNDVSGLDEALIDVEEREDEFVLSHRFAIANPLNECDGYRRTTELVEEYVVEQTNKILDSLGRRLGKRITIRNG